MFLVKPQTRLSFECTVNLIVLSFVWIYIYLSKVQM